MDAVHARPVQSSRLFLPWFLRRVDTRETRRYQVEVPMLWSAMTRANPEVYQGSSTSFDQETHCHLAQGPRQKTHCGRWGGGGHERRSTHTNREVSRLFSVCGLFIEQRLNLVLDFHTTTTTTNHHDHHHCHDRNVRLIRCFLQCAHSLFQIFAVHFDCTGSQNLVAVRIFEIW